ncbi:MAG: hypothetical protein FWF51_12760 [Chitinivibrionia bacterium]|nr:hypothetical protein [Chitinivibrionia bacterium]
MNMMSANFDSVNYDIMFSKLSDFFIEQNNKNIVRRRKKTTEQKTILEKLEKKIEKKLENIYKEQIKTMWHYLNEFECRKNEQQERIIKSQETEIEQLNKLAKTTSQHIENLVSNDEIFIRNFDIFSDTLKATYEEIQQIEDVNQRFDNIIRIFKIFTGQASESEIKAQEEINKKIEEEQAQEAKIKAEKELEERKQAEQKQANEEAQKLQWYDLSEANISAIGYDYKYGKIYCRKSDMNNTVIIMAEEGKDILVRVKSNGKVRMLPAINSTNKLSDIRKGVEKEFELLLAGKNYLTFW